MTNFGIQIAQEIIIDEIKQNNINIKLDSFYNIINKLNKFKVPYIHYKIKINELKLFNNYFNIEEIIKISKNIDKLGPVIISNDNYIIDGKNKAILYNYAKKEYIDTIKIKYPKHACEFLFNENILVEDNNKKIVILSGRFQPFHINHYNVYKSLVNKFGIDSVYIATSNIVNKNSPFSFNEKKKIITTMFNIPSNKIVKVKNTYVPSEILNKFKQAIYIAVVGEKDKNRLSGKYFKPYKDNIKLDNYDKHGYYYIAPLQTVSNSSKLVNGTYIRETFPKLNLSLKKDIFKELYPKFDKNIFNLFNKTLTENYNIIRFIQTQKFKNIITENNTNWPDDGPNAFFPTFNIYKNIAKERTKQTGYKILNYIINNKYEDFYDHPIYPNGPVMAVSFGPAGVAGKVTAMNQIDLNNKLAYKKWLIHIQNIIDLTGYTYIADINPNLFISENIIKSSLDNRKLLLCGGAGGHLSHPFDNMDLTFQDLKNIITLGLEGKLESVSEKVDGQNIFFSYINGKVKAARNGGHIKNFGKTALDMNGIEKMFAGRGDISNAFTFAIQDIGSALKNISRKKLDSIFKNGKVFMNVEIVFPPTTNVIPYNYNALIFHGTNEYDKDGNIKKVNTSGGKLLLKLINKINANVQNIFNIRGPNLIKVPKSKDFNKQKGIYLSQLNKLKNRFNLKDNDKILQYHIEWWKQFITNKAKEFKYEITNKVFETLLNRWAYNNKSYKIVDIRKLVDNDDFLNWLNKFDKTDYQKQFKKNIEPFELLFLKLGAQILSNISDILAVNPSKTTQEIKKQFRATVKELSKTTDINKLTKFKEQLAKLNKLGGIKAILPIEGLAFMYKNKLYKLTGSYAPLNRILGILKF